MRRQQVCRHGYFPNLGPLLPISRQVETSSLGVGAGVKHAISMSYFIFAMIMSDMALSSHCTSYFAFSTIGLWVVCCADAQVAPKLPTAKTCSELALPPFSGPVASAVSRRYAWLKRMQGYSAHDRLVQICGKPQGSCAAASPTTANFGAARSYCQGRHSGGGGAC